MIQLLNTIAHSLVYFVYFIYIKLLIIILLCIFSSNKSEFILYYILSAKNLSSLLFAVFLLSCDVSTIIIIYIKEKLTICKVFVLK